MPHSAVGRRPRLAGELPAEVDKHPNRRYFILKSIIVNNLYGVDIMEEAVEICKLRLFLKLVAQVDRVKDLEPLPDIDFNIRSGNTLVGFVSVDEIRRTAESDASGQGQLVFGETEKAIRRIEEEAKIVEGKFQMFHKMQTDYAMDASAFAAAKQELRSQLKQLADELDRYLASEYDVDASKTKAYDQWRKSHQPFHWFAEFYGIMSRGGFCITIGNPPYKELRSVIEYSVRGYTTVTTRNLYPLMLERSFSFSQRGGRLGFIVPVSSISTSGYQPLQEIMFRHPGHFSSFDDRPSRLFEGLEHIQLTIHLIENVIIVEPFRFATECYRWNAIERSTLFQLIEYESIQEHYLSGALPKLSNRLEHSILNKVWRDAIPLGGQVEGSGRYTVYFSRKVHNFFQVLDFVPEVYDGRGKLRPPTELKELRFSHRAQAAAVFCLLNSSLFRWFVNVFSDCHHVNKREVEGFRCNVAQLLRGAENKWVDLASRLSKRLKDTSEYREMRFKHDHLRVQCIIPKNSKLITQK
jgi:hypothetical protein